jgi:uncharacterized protein
VEVTVGPADGDLKQVLQLGQCAVGGHVDYPDDCGSDVPQGDAQSGCSHAGTLATLGNVPRDRDPNGRARNARPRDGLGRPLPRGSEGVARLPDDLILPPEESLIEAQRLLDEGLPFHAHEVLEGTWKAAPPAERNLWQGLAQLAVGVTHLERGNPTGAVALLRRGVARIQPYQNAAPYDIDVRGLLGWADDVIAAAAASPGPADAPVPVPRLTRRA